MRTLLIALVLLLPALAVSASCGGAADPAQSDSQPVTEESDVVTEPIEPSPTAEPAQPTASSELGPDESESLEEPTPSLPTETKPEPDGELEQVVPASDPSRDPAPEIRGQTLDGSELALADFLGTPVFVNVWASW